MSETLRPFENEQDSLVIDALTIENRVDQLEVYGSLAITRDKIGSAYALQLKQILDPPVLAMEHDPLPPHQTPLNQYDQGDQPV